MKDEVKKLINLCDKSPTKLCSQCEIRKYPRNLSSDLMQYCNEAKQFVVSLRECPITKKMRDSQEDK